MAFVRVGGGRGRDDVGETGMGRFTIPRCFDWLHSGIYPRIRCGIMVGWLMLDFVDRLVLVLEWLSMFADGLQIRYYSSCCTTTLYNQADSE